MVVRLVKKAEKGVLSHRRMLLRKGLAEAELLAREGEEAAAVDKATKKLFADVEMRRRAMEKHQQANKQREADKDDDDQTKLKEEYNFHKSWNKEERVEKRVGSWRDFGASGKNKKPRVGSNWKPEENHTAAGAGVDVTGGEKGYRHDWK